MSDKPRITPGAPEPPPAFAVLAEKPNGADTAVPIVLPNGHAVLLERPKGSIVASVIMIASEITGEMKVGTMAQAVALSALQPYIEALMHVTALDDKRYRRITNAEQYQTLADIVEDEGIAAIQDAIFKHWPPVTAEQAAAIKKNRDRSQLS